MAGALFFRLFFALGAERGRTLAIRRARALARAAAETASPCRRARNLLCCACKVFLERLGALRAELALDDRRAALLAWVRHLDACLDEAALADHALDHVLGSARRLDELGALKEGLGPPGRAVRSLACA